jgi:hypothetical protein
MFCGFTLPAPAPGVCANPNPPRTCCGCQVSRSGAHSTARAGTSRARAQACAKQLAQLPEGRRPAVEEVTARVVTAVVNSVIEESRREPALARPLPPSTAQSQPGNRGSSRGLRTRIAGWLVEEAQRVSSSRSPSRPSSPSSCSTRRSRAAARRLSARASSPTITGASR